MRNELQIRENQQQTVSRLFVISGNRLQCMPIECHLSCINVVGRRMEKGRCVCLRQVVCWQRKKDDNDACTRMSHLSPVVANGHRAFTRSSKRSALAGVFWIHLLEVCWTFAGSCKHPITIAPLLVDLTLPEFAQWLITEMMITRRTSCSRYGDVSRRHAVSKNEANTPFTRSSWLDELARRAG